MTNDDVSFHSPLLKQAVSSFPAPDYKCLGGFANTRKVFNWEGHVLELDETKVRKRGGDYVITGVRFNCLFSIRLPQRGKSK